MFLTLILFWIRKLSPAVWAFQTKHHQKNRNLLKATLETTQEPVWNSMALSFCLPAGASNCKSAVQAASSTLNVQQQRALLSRQQQQ
jgi:hypothetical protein